MDTEPWKCGECDGELSFQFNFILIIDLLLMTIKFSNFKCKCPQVAGSSGVGSIAPEPFPIGS